MNDILGQPEIIKRRKLPLHIKLETAIRMCLLLVPDKFKKHLIL